MRPAWLVEAGFLGLMELQEIGRSPYSATCVDTGRRLVDPVAEEAAKGGRLGRLPSGDRIVGRNHDRSEGPTWAMAEVREAVAWASGGDDGR
jgi:hypothetical protein